MRLFARSLLAVAAWLSIAGGISPAPAAASVDPGRATASAARASRPVWQLVAVDLDADGDLDVVAATDRLDLVVWRNNGHAGFTRESWPDAARLWALFDGPVLRVTAVRPDDSAQNEDASTRIEIARALTPRFERAGFAPETPASDLLTSSRDAARLRGPPLRESFGS